MVKKLKVVKMVSQFVTIVTRLGAENGYLHIDHDADAFGSWLRLRLLAHGAPAQLGSRKTLSVA